MSNINELMDAVTAPFSRVTTGSPIPPTPPMPMRKGLEIKEAVIDELVASPLVDRIAEYLRDSLGAKPEDRAEAIVEMIYPLTAPAPISHAESTAQGDALQMAGAITAAFGITSPPWSGRNFAFRMADELRPLAEMAKEHADTVRDQSQRIDQLADTLAATQAGHASGMNLQKSFLANAEKREAVAMYNFAGVKLQHAQLLEQIATAISRGHLSGEFFNNLNEWSK